MGKFKFLLLVVFALNVCVADSSNFNLWQPTQKLPDPKTDKNYIILTRIIDLKKTFPTHKDIETCAVTQLLPQNPDPNVFHHEALGWSHSYLNMVSIDNRIFK